MADNGGSLMTVPPEDFAVQIHALRRLHSAQSRLVAAVQELSLVRTLPAIQEIVRHAARELLGADGATFVLRDGDQCHYADEEAISPLWKSQRFPMTACISGWVMLNAQHAMIPDIYSDDRIPADAYRPTFVKSLVMVPIRLKAPIGAIGIYWARQRITSDEEIALIQALANTTSVAMENVKVYTELEQRVDLRTQQLHSLNHELEAFSYSVSHDLRAPLRAINGFTQLLAEEIKDGASDEARRCMTIVRDSTKQMGAQIDSLMVLAKVARQEMCRIEVDLAAVARKVAERLREENPAREVEMVIPEKLTAKGDAGLISVVLENLLSNAWKYTGKTPAARIELGLGPAGDGTPAFFVRDNGVGFESVKADRLFTPFGRLHTAAEFPGTGVGLATVQRIIHRHGGRIWATAEVGRGATFLFTFPNSEADWTRG
jgi:signal transduction histidine kinase